MKHLFTFIIECITVIVINLNVYGMISKWPLPWFTIFHFLVLPFLLWGLQKWSATLSHTSSKTSIYLRYLFGGKKKKKHFQNLKCQTCMENCTFYYNWLFLLSCIQNPSSGGACSAEDCVSISVHRLCLRMCSGMYVGAHVACENSCELNCIQTTCECLNTQHGGKWAGQPARKSADTANKASMEDSQ